MLDFIINPLAGGKKGKKIKRATAIIADKLGAAGIKYAFHYTEYPKHATVLATNLIQNGATDIIVVGGDGSLH